MISYRTNYYKREDRNEPLGDNEGNSVSYKQVYARFLDSCIQIVLQNESHLFSLEEQECFESFSSKLSDDAKYIFVRLFFFSASNWIRKYRYYDRFKNYCNIDDALDQLSTNIFMEDSSKYLKAFKESVENDNSFKSKVPSGLNAPTFLIKLSIDHLSLADSLSLLTRVELIDLAKELHISLGSTSKSAGVSKSTSSKSGGGLSKRDIIKKISQNNDTQPSIVDFFKPKTSKNCSSPKNVKVHKYLKVHLKAVYVNPFARICFNRLFVAFFRRSKPDPMIDYARLALLADTNALYFPQYQVHRDRSYFSCREDFLAYEEALKIKDDIDFFLVNNFKKQVITPKALNIYKTIQPRFMPTLQASMFAENTTVFKSVSFPSIEQYCVYSTAEWIYIQVANRLVQYLDPIDEWIFLNTFLSQRLFHNSARGDNYGRKAHIETNSLSKNWKFALEVSKNHSPSLSPEAAKLALEIEHYVNNATKFGQENDLKDKATRFWYTMAFDTCVQGIKDPLVHEVYHIPLRNRIKSMENKLKIKTSERLDFAHVALTKPKEVYIAWEKLTPADIYEPVKKEESFDESPNLDEYFDQTSQAINGSASSPFVNMSLDLPTIQKHRFARPQWVDETNPQNGIYVEEAALQYYRRTYGFEGQHFENSILTTIFGLLFWDIIFEPPSSKLFLEYCASLDEQLGINKIDETNPGLSLPRKVPTFAFQHKYQAAPADFFSSSFYICRKEQIDVRLLTIKGNSRLSESEDSKNDPLAMDFIINTIKTVHEREFEKKTHCVGISWFELDPIMCIVEYLGSYAIYRICDLLAKNYRVLKSGMPDLCLWNNELRKCKFVEVKSTDTTSFKQEYWIDYLTRSGIEVEVCKVSDPKSFNEKYRSREKVENS